jgi:hypothetical protein
MTQHCSIYVVCSATKIAPNNKEIEVSIIQKVAEL